MTAFALRRMRRRIDFQHDDLDVCPDRKGPPESAFLRDAGFAQGDDTGMPGGQEDEHTEFLVSLDLSRQARARNDAGMCCKNRFARSTIRRSWPNV
jgi:hypothetical protein